MRVQRLVMPNSGAESWTLLGDDGRPVEPAERFLAFLGAIERSPNTIKAYAHDLKDWFEFLGGRGLEWSTVTVEDVAGFVAWLRLPPAGRAGQIAVLPSVQTHCGSASVNRKLAALASFCEFHAGHGVPLAGVLVTTTPGSRRAGATSFKPFLHHITKSAPQRRRTIALPATPPRPKVLTVGQVQAILDACGHRRDRLLFGVLLDTGMFSGGPAVWRDLAPGICPAQKLLVSTLACATSVVHEPGSACHRCRVAVLSCAMSSRFAARAAARSWSRSSSCRRRSRTCCSS